VLFIDADEYLVYDDDFALPSPLDKDYYYLTLTCGSQWKKVSLINMHKDWEWYGVLHEVIAPPADRTFDTLQKVVNIYTVDGARSKDPKKYEKDAEVLEEALRDDPNNSRYIYYLAKSYAAAGNKEKAIEKFKRRFDFATYNDSEAFWSLLEVAKLQEELNLPSDVVIESYKKACQYARNRAEPYYHLSRYYKTINDHQRSFLVASIGKTLPIVTDLLWVDDWIYEYGMLMEYSVSAYWIGKYKECQEASLEMLEIEDLPEAYRECALQNLGFANSKLLEEACAA
jgi:tetratricopeptide (TPR) repeat protein